MTDFPGVSYIMPVLNEADYLADAVRSVLNQDYSGTKELVLALGPSTDTTDEVARALADSDPRIILVDNPQGPTPIALNLAVKASTQPVVIRVDAHSDLPENYTRRGVETLYRVGAYDVGGLMDARGRNPRQRAIAAAYNSPLGFGGAAYHSGAPEGPAESAYLGIFRREVFDEVGMFDESMWRAQDWELCHRIRAAGYKVWFDPSLKVGYYPRETFRALMSQSFASGTWRAEIARRHKDGESIRHAIPPMMVLGVSLGVVAAVALPLIGKELSTGPKYAVRALAAVPVLYLGLSVVGALRSQAQTLKEKLLTAIAFPTIHFSWAFGYIRGRIFGSKGIADRGRVKSVDHGRVKK